MPVSSFRVFEIAALEGLSLSERDYIYEAAMELYLGEEIELEELLSVRDRLFPQQVSNGVVEPDRSEWGDPEESAAEDVEIMREMQGVWQKAEPTDETIIVGTVEKEKPVATGERNPNICARCGRRLEEMQVMMGERLCTECLRRSRL